MKKIVQLLPVLALVLCAMLFTSCYKHAYSDSSNKFEYVRGGTAMGHVGNSLTVAPGESVQFYASTSPAHERITGGSYKAEIEDKSVASVSVSGDGVVVTGRQDGVTSLHLDFLWKGFDLYKTVSIVVKTAESGE